MAIFDLRESIIPFSLLQISNHFKSMESGEIVEILCCDASIEKDLRCILPRREYETLFADLTSKERNEFCIRLRKI